MSDNGSNNSDGPADTAVRSPYPTPAALLVGGDLRDLEEFGALETVQLTGEESDALANTHPASLGDRTGAAACLPVIPRDSFGEGREIARGGLGRVSAVHDQRLDREVAIKELLERTDAQQARFLREVRITARLEHPSIVPIYEAGYWPSGAPFYSMRLLSGRTLAELLDDATAIDDRLRYLPNMIAVADAIAYAHSKRIIHRDLKPANVIVGDFGETIVVDWGLAKDLDGDSDSEHDEPSTEESYRDSAAELTLMGMVMGTPSYMAPEQVRSAEVDEHADIYGLGAILYHLCAGAPPHEGRNVNEMLDWLAREVPRPLAEIAPTAPQELVTIVAKAMARKPGDRYASAKNLADDLRRFQNGQRVSVHHYSLRALLRRWLHKNRAPVAVAVCLLALLALAGALSVRRILFESEVARANYHEARAAREREMEQNHQLLIMQAAYEPDGTASVARLKALPRSAAQWPLARLVATEAANRGIARHVWRDHDSVIYDIALSRDGTMLASVSQDQTISLRNRVTGEEQRLRGHTDWVHHAAFSPTEPLVASAGRDGTVRLWNFAGSVVDRFVDGEAPVNQVAFSPDGTFLAWAGDAGTVTLRNLKTRTSRVLSGHRGRVWALAFAPGGAWLASASDIGEVRLWSVLDDRDGLVLAAHGGEVQHVTFSRDGQRLCSASYDGMARLWQIPSGRLLASYAHFTGVEQAHISPDGTSLVSAASDGVVRLWSLGSGKSRELGHHEGRAHWATFSPDGQLVASAGDDGVIRVWDVASGMEARRYTGSRETVYTVLFSPDGKSLLSAGKNTGVREWRLDQLTHRRLQARSYVNALVYSPDGRYLASAENSGVVTLWDLASGMHSEIGHHDGLADELAFSPDGQLVASGSRDGGLRVYDRVRAAQTLVGAHRDRVTALAFLPDSGVLVSSSHDRTLRLWNMATGEFAELKGNTDRVRHVAVSPDGATLASASSDGTVRLWEVATSAQTVLGEHDSEAMYVEFSPRGDWLLSTGRDRKVRLWDVTTGRMNVLSGHRHPVLAARFSPDGQHLVSLGDGSQDVLIWDLAAGSYMRLPVQHSKDAAWSRDSMRVATVSEDGKIQLWDVGTGKAHVIHQLLYAAANVVVFSPDGKGFATGDRREGIDLWRDDLPGEPSKVFDWLREVTSAEISIESPLATP